MPPIVSADFPELQVRINGVPLGAYNVALTELDGWIASPTVDRTRIAVPGRLGVASALLATTRARVTVLRGVVEADSVAEREAALQRLSRALVGDLLVSTDDLPDWLTICSATGLTYEPIGDPFVTYDVAVVITLEATAPVRYARDLVASAVDTTPHPLHIGSAGAAAVLYVVGPTTGETTVELRRAQGDVAASFTLAGNLTASTAYRVDFDARTAQLLNLGTGVVSDAEAAIGGTIFALDGRFAGEPAEPRSWPTLVLSQSSGMVYVRPIIPL